MFFAYPAIIGQFGQDNNAANAFLIVPAYNLDFSAIDRSSLITLTRSGNNNPVMVQNDAVVGIDYTGTAVVDQDYTIYIVEPFTIAQGTYDNYFEIQLANKEFCYPLTIIVSFNTTDTDYTINPTFLTLHIPETPLFTQFNASTTHLGMCLDLEYNFFSTQRDYAPDVPLNINSTAKNVGIVRIEDSYFTNINNTTAPDEISQYNPVGGTAILGVDYEIDSSNSSMTVFKKLNTTLTTNKYILLNGYNITISSTPPPTTINNTTPEIKIQASNPILDDATGVISIIITRFAEDYASLLGEAVDISFTITTTAVEGVDFEVLGNFPSPNVVRINLNSYCTRILIRRLPSDLRVSKSLTFEFTIPNTYQINAIHQSTVYLNIDPFIISRLSTDSVPLSNRYLEGLLIDRIDRTFSIYATADIVSTSGNSITGINFRPNPGVIKASVTSTAKPKLVSNYTNFLDVMYFDVPNIICRTDNRSEFLTYSEFQQFTYIMVFKPDSPNFSNNSVQLFASTANNSSFIDVSSTNTKGAFVNLNSDYSITAAIYSTNSGTEPPCFIRTAPNTVLTNDFNILIWSGTNVIYNTASPYNTVLPNYTVRLNGLDVTPVDIVDYIDRAPCVYETNGVGCLHIGGRTANNNAFKGYIGEFAKYDSVYSLANQIKLEGVLARRWDLSTNLPVDHYARTECNIFYYDKKAKYADSSIIDVSLYYSSGGSS